MILVFILEIGRRGSAESQRTGELSYIQLSLTVIVCARTGEVARFILIIDPTYIDSTLCTCQALKSGLLIQVVF